MKIFCPDPKRISSLVVAHTASIDVESFPSGYPVIVAKLHSARAFDWETISVSERLSALVV